MILAVNIRDFHTTKVVSNLEFQLLKGKQASSHDTVIWESSLLGENLKNKLNLQKIHKNKVTQGDTKAFIISSRWDIS